MKVTTGTFHSCAQINNLKQSKIFSCWGDNKLNQCSVPLSISTALNISSISAGGAHTCALVSSISSRTKAIECWGYDEFGQTIIPRNGSGKDTTHIQSGEWHNCAVSLHKGLYCWGENK
mmetsp:Transcript_11861/g.10111  ORF Transcript_11861/g.10111 Transcript_11861/m.10111 type:complete len:119 (-) Transcript_11861:825-1181(-)